MQHDSGAHARAYLSTLAAGKTERRIAYFLLALSAAIFAVIVPFAKVKLTALPAFIPLYQSALATSDFVTAALLFGQYALLKSRALLALACGYLFSAAMALVHLLTFPDLFAPGGWLDAGPQTSAWLYMLWHAGFPLFVAAYALLREDRKPLAHRGRSAVVAVAAVAVLVFATTWITGPGHRMLPEIMDGDRYTAAMRGVVAIVWALCLLALVLVWRRGRSVLDVWLLVVMGAWTSDIALAFVFNSGRYDIGFYAGRLFGLMAATFVLIVLLVENAAIYADLDSLNLQLEQRLAGIIDSAMDAVISVDGNQRIVLFNAAAETIFQCPKEEAMGAPLTKFIPARFRPQHGELMRRFGETRGASRRMSANRVVTAVRRSGEEFPIDASISHFRIDDGEYYTVILRDVTERVRTEEELRKSREELIEVGRVGSTAREQERARIARELHDELAQGLAAVKMDVTGIEAPSGSPLADRARGMLALLDRMIAATRRIAADLRPQMLDELGLAAAVEWLATSFTERHGIECRLDMDPPDIDIPDPYATAVFRILQESLTNIAKHAGATRVDVKLRQTGGEITLAVNDNGRGFDMATPRKRASFGLMGLRERVYLVGGRMDIRSAPGAGTTIELAIPLQAATETA